MPEWLLVLWERFGLEQKAECYALGWKEHFLIFNQYLAEGLSLDHEQVAACIGDAVAVMARWEDSYPDPTMLTFLLYMKRHRPEQYALYRTSGGLPEPESCRIDPEIYRLIYGLHHALSHSPNPMRMKENFDEFDEEIEGFYNRFGCRFILPFDGRNSEEVYMMTGHLDDMVTALERL
ncbi:MAG: hypothetical protein HQL53_09505 [Magnetococcales bacterium]|nr:hypothetical protein [Magnetococcales bacterium]